MKFYIRLITVILLYNSSFAQTNFVKDSLDSYIKREMTRWNLPGMAIAVVKDGKVIHMKGYGLANVTAKTPVTENTVFQIASNSKAFTGTSLALLEHYGKLKLNDKVKKYLPYFKMSEDWRTNEVTIADILSHRIGYETFQSDLLNWNCTRSRKELIENMANVTPKYSLREKYGYCNVGFLTAGEIIPAVCDTSWDDYLKYHFFKPLKMTNTNTKYSTFTTSKNSSKAYTLVDDKIVELRAANVDNLGPAASITSSVNDLSKWLILQLDNGKFNGKQIIPEDVILRTRESFNIVEAESKPGSNFETYGLGWFLKDAHGKKIVTHDGGANGFLSKTILIPEEHLGVVILTNSDAQWFFEALGNQIINDVTKQSYSNLSEAYYKNFKDFKTKESEEIAKLKNMAMYYKTPANAYASLVGIYTNKVYGKIAIQAKEEYAEVTFEYHPQYIGKLQFTNVNSMILEYNDPTLGTQEIKCKNEGDQKTIEIKVSDFVDMDTYLFTKISDTYTPFVKKTDTKK